jgi:predicted DNA-binding antitoxin AbrB/MazE fold protein
MSTTFTVIHEGGVLRPLKPLSLPEHARVQVKIVKSTRKKTAASGREQVYNALHDAGLVKPQAIPDALLSVSEMELAAAADALGTAGSISDLIIAERAESF